MHTPTGSPDPQPAEYRATARTRPTRKPYRARYDEATVHAILDEEFVCHLGFVADGAPVVLPTLYARVGHRLYLHGSTGSRPQRSAAEGVEGLAVCVTVTIADGLVLARSAMNHSMNYRSVTAHGTAYRVTSPDELSVAYEAVVDQVVAGRAADCRAPSAKERAQTAVLRLDLDEVSAKVRTGGVSDEPEDVGLPYWAGVVPLTRTAGAPVQDPDQSADIPLPPYLSTKA